MKISNPVKDNNKLFLRMKLKIQRHIKESKLREN